MNKKNVGLPINGKDIRNFDSWIDWDGPRVDSPGFHFAAYTNTNGVPVLGLPKKTPVRAMADGRVYMVTDPGDYSSAIGINHGKGFSTLYSHVSPMVRERDEVSEGDKIAQLFKDPVGDIGRLVHLYVETPGLPDLFEEKFPELFEYRAEPQGTADFLLFQLSQQNEIYTAHFRKLELESDLFR